MANGSLESKAVIRSKETGPGRFSNDVNGCGQMGATVTDAHAFDSELIVRLIECCNYRVPCAVVSCLPVGSIAEDGER